jgi:excisionase family DNA binding protein
MTPDEAAERLGVNRRYVKFLADRGELPVIRLGLRTPRFRLSDVERLVARGVLSE